ncbi:unnamed protein product [Trifolium pratense]|uniref:Uncharacterized protein n=1 Tax=Trifolium pratense TaxID=57577 RepID=A0ACB0JRN6_TRIPR|nr:unnamed protein product [Trifolium pratense]
MTTLSNNVNNNRINPNRGGERIPVIRVRNNNQTIVTYIKSEHTRGESDLEYYERRYYKRLKDDYYTFKISDSTYRCPFCCNKDYSLSDLLRHAYRMSDDNQPSHPEKLDDSADKSKPKETEVVVEPDVSVEGEESKDENKEADEVEQVHDVIRDSQHDEVVDFEIDNTKSAMVSNVINPNVQSAPLICVQTEATPVTDCIVPASKYHNESMVAFERIMDAATEIQISENEPLEVDTWSSQTSLIQHHYYYLISELDVSDTNSYMLTKVGQTSFCDKFPTLYAIFEEWDPGGNLDVLAQDGSSHFTQWDPGGWSLVHWRNQLAREAPYQDENSGSSSFEKKGGSSSGEKKLISMDEAKVYLNEVKDALKDETEKYDDFLWVMKDFKEQRMNIEGVISKVKELLEGHEELLVKFNTFLPDGYSISP